MIVNDYFFLLDKGNVEAKSLIYFKDNKP